MLTPRAKMGTDGAYGLGWMLSPGGSYFHTGSDGTMGWVDPARATIGMVLTQSPGGINPRNEFRDKIAQALTAPR